MAAETQSLGCHSISEQGLTDTGPIGEQLQEVCNKPVLRSLSWFTLQ